VESTCIALYHVRVAPGDILPAGPYFIHPAYARGYPSVYNRHSENRATGYCADRMLQVIFPWYNMFFFMVQYDSSTVQYDYSALQSDFYRLSGNVDSEIFSK
jgi:hypothetical protein